MFDLLPVGAYRTSVDGRLLRANAALVHMHAYDSEAELLAAANDRRELLYADPNRRNEFISEMLAENRVINFISAAFRRQTREPIWISENAHVVYDDNGEVLYFEGTVEDITDRLRGEQKLAESERRYRALTERAQLATAIVTADGLVLYASPGIEQLFGVKPEAFVGQNLFDSMHQDDLAEHRAELRSVSTKTNTGRESVARHLHTDGNYRFLASLGKDCSDDPAVGGIVLNWRDVTESTVARRRLVELAQTDALTGLNNRAHFEQICETRLLDAVAGGASQRFAMLFIDLNRFKLVNDAHGHSIGDGVLRHIADRLRRAVRPEHTLARLGGDEFAVLIPITEPADGADAAQHLLREFIEPVPVRGMTFDLGASIGFAVFPDDASTFHKLLAYADLAMFTAKARGTSSVERFEPTMAQRARNQLSVANDLRFAVERGELFACYQPIVNVETGHWQGVEALARWQHPVRGLLMPADFIATAEEQRLIGRVGREIARMAIAQVGQWSARFNAPMRLTINVSVHQLREIDFVDFLLKTLAEHHLPPRRLFVEVTESVLVEADDISVNTLGRLRASNVRVVLDDLGAGYSSLAYLKRLRIDLVKLDRGFIEGLPHRRTDVAIVRALSTLARTLGIHVIGEGVENAAQAQFLKEEGVLYGQGFLYDRPLSAVEIEHRLVSGANQISHESGRLR
jgi:diguanylate cyclase (GGDEF)-like protein/PAS domain S-box-containing protein